MACKRQESDVMRNGGHDFTSLKHKEKMNYRSMRLMVIGLVVACLSQVVPKALASRGDEWVVFRRCVQQCTQIQNGSAALPNQWINGVEIPQSRLCSEDRDNGAKFDTLGYLGSLANSSSPLLRLLNWDCESDCQYECMWTLEGYHREKGGKPLKYFGKWPFSRILGVQEPASVVLSVMNLVANVQCASIILRMCGSKGCVDWNGAREALSANLWIIHFILACNSWFWSAVFHTRDTRVTERFDYFSAGAVIGYDLFLSLCRVVPGLKGIKSRYMLGTVLSLFYLRHAYFMHYVKFDYGYHVGLCIAAGLVQSIIWLVWTFSSSEGRSHPGRKYLVSFIVSVNIAVLLEILDFPPLLGIVDAHALWHLATIPLIYVWCGFVMHDISKGTDNVSKTQ
eukprot:jgi/Picsp_1/789/NSC_04278-R1_per1-like family protein